MLAVTLSSFIAIALAKIADLKSSKSGDTDFAPFEPVFDSLRNSAGQAQLAFGSSIGIAASLAKKEKE